MSVQYIKLIIFYLHRLIHKNKESDDAKLWC
ncbi:hypothetical protein YPF_4178 [Yersinia pestis biovar Orientalis str. India 195]|nr:hypothetical protein YPF_4178 [Yersinia pestis biovar Orientalis str. India 195]EEO85535.1 hypothetical protein YPH_1398 [Yersinia pestis biovar Orientalis str. PEXU2]EEO88421.1 hypothetical protein YPS_4444 [Yersinia pestis Pestoides A]